MASKKRVDAVEQWFLDSGSTSPRPCSVNVPVKFRDGNIIFPGGKRFGVDDFSRFLVSDEGSYKPVACVDNYSEDRVIDFAPLLAVGAAELIVIFGLPGSGIDEAYIEQCCNRPFFADIKTVLAESRMFLESADDPVIKFSSALRSGRIDARFTAVRRIYRTLMALKLVNPQSFCEAILEAMRIVSPCTTALLLSRKVYMESVIEHGDSWYYTLVHKKLFKFRSAWYGTFKEGHRISDCRGLGVAAFCLLMCYLYRDFVPDSGDFLHGQMIHDTAMPSRIMKIFKRSLGYDAVGRYIRYCDWPDETADDDERSLCRQFNISTVGCGERVMLGRHKIGRNMYESAIMFAHAIGQRKLSSSCPLPALDCHYGSIYDIVQSFMGFLLSDRGVKLEETLRSDNHEKLLNEVLERVGIDKIRADAKKDAESHFYAENSRLKKEAHDAKSELKHIREQKNLLENSLIKQADVETALRDEVRNLHIRLHELTAVDDIGVVEESQEDTTVSIADMLAYVNQFKLVFVGGQTLLSQRAKQFGFTNFCQISEFSDVDLTGDFFCICTRFISHKLEYSVEARNSEMLDQFFYFNGTNLEMLLRTCYNAIKKYMSS